MCISGGRIGCICNILTSYIFIGVPKNGGPKCPECIICGGPGKFGIGRPCFTNIGGLYVKGCTLAGCCCRFFVLFPLFLLLEFLLLFPTVLFPCCDCLPFLLLFPPLLLCCC